MLHSMYFGNKKKKETTGNNFFLITICLSNCLQKISCYQISIKYHKDVASGTGKRRGG